MTPSEDAAELDFPAPEITALTAPYWRALDEGRLVYQRCPACRHAWLPARGECPGCLGRDAAWETAQGSARLVSWVVYHHGYHAFFTPRLPYVVAVVELAEGPRLISNIIGDRDALRIDMPLALVIEREAGIALARFKPA